jgi:hypothetical protein
MENLVRFSFDGHFPFLPGFFYFYAIALRPPLLAAGKDQMHNCGMNAGKQPLNTWLFRQLYSKTTKMGSSQWDLVLNFK